MDYTDLKKKFLWFTLTFYIVILAAAYLQCRCAPWLLIFTLYVFFTMYLLGSIGGKRLLDRLSFNPLTYLLISFFAKVILVIGFTFFLVAYFDLSKETILLLVVSGYIVAAIFDFLLLMKSTKNVKS